MKSFFLKIYHLKPFFNHRKAWFLLIACSIFVLLRLPSLIEPYWYGDEGIYQVVARALLQGKTLYKDIWDNKPPLLYIIYALTLGNLFLVKLLSLLSGLLSVVVFFLLTEKIFNKILSRNVATLVYAVLFGLPVLEGNVANAENFMLLPIILSAYFVISFSENKKNTIIIAAGFLLSIAFITKIVAVFDFAAFFLFMFFIEWSHQRKISVRTYVIYSLSFLSLLIFSSAYFFSVGAFKDFIGSVFLQNVSYVGDQNKFIFPMGILVIKTIILFVSLLILFIKKNKISKSTLFIYMWIIFSIFNAFFSERPYIHYLLVLLPAFALLTGHFFDRTKTRIIDGSIIFIIIFFALFHFQIYYKTFTYYGNYVKFLTNQKTIVDYEAFFDAYTPRDYDIANFIDMNVAGNEKIFLWSDSAQIYALSNKLPLGKYIVAYHITFYKNADVITKEQIEKAQPKYIIQTIEEPFVKDISSSYRLRYIMEGARIYEREI